MPAVDLLIIEAKLALDYMRPEQLPELAANLLEMGLDGPAVRRIAGLNGPSGWETDQLRYRLMDEACLQRVTQEE